MCIFEHIFFHTNTKPLSSRWQYRVLHAYFRIYIYIYIYIYCLLKMHFIKLTIVTLREQVVFESCYQNIIVIRVIAPFL